MRIINLIIELTQSRSLELIQILMRFNKYVTIYQIQKEDRRNFVHIQRDLARFRKRGIVKIKTDYRETGRGYHKISYKINREHPLIIMLSGGIKNENCK